MDARTCHHSSVKYNSQIQSFMFIYNSFKTTDVLDTILSHKNSLKVELKQLNIKKKLHSRELFYTVPDLNET